MVKWLETPDATVFPLGEGFDTSSIDDFEAVNSDFGNALTLVGYTNQNRQVQAGEPLELTLYWLVGSTLMPQPAPTRGAPISAFVHLVDGDPAAKVAEFDGWQTALRGLEPGDIIAQHVTLNVAEDAAPKHYDLLVGLYSPQNWQRLTTVQEGEERDYAVAGTIEVAP